MGRKRMRGIKYKIGRRAGRRAEGDRTASGRRDT